MRLLQIVLATLFLPVALAQADETYFRVPLRDAAVQGPETAKITIVEFSDFQCPFCGRVEGTLKQLKTIYAGEIRFVFKHNPLPFHPNAFPAAEAALAAGEQGQFWEMHDLLFARQRELSREKYEAWAGELGLNLQRFRAALDSHKFKAQIEHDQEEARSFNANGTPAFFVNGRFLSGAQPLDAFEKVIDEEMKRANKLLASGTQRTRLYEVLISTGKLKADAPTPSRPAEAPTALAASVTDLGDSPQRGPNNAKVTIVEWSDFQCPFCSRAEKTMQDVLEHYPQEVRIIYKHQPLPFHPNALPAALASEAARRQGKFWEFHDLAFANQKDLSPEKYEEWALQLGLDVGQFSADLKDPALKARIDRDAAYGGRVGANGTPTFFFNGRKLVGALPYEAFKTVIDEEIKKANALLSKGVPTSMLYERLMAENVASAPKPPTPAPAETAVVPVSVRGAPVRGDDSAKVTLVEFTDFQCPYCSRANATLEALRTKYGRDLRIVFKNQPLPFHPNAFPAAEAAFAAGEQGRFWEMHDLMFAHQRDLSQAKYDAWAEDLGLDMQRFHAALDSHKFKAQIERDAKEGSSIGASGTPTFFINGHKLVGAQPQEGFERVIDDELQHAAKLLRQGVPANALYDHMMKEAPAPAAEEDEEEGD